MEPSGIYGNVVEFNLGTIRPNDRGAVVIITRIKDEIPPETNLIFTSVLSYIDQFGVGKTATSYMTVKTGRSVQGSSTLSLFGSLFGSILA